MKRRYQILVYTSLVLLGGCHSHHDRGFAGAAPPVPDRFAQPDAGVVPPVRPAPVETDRIAEVPRPEVPTRESGTGVKIPPVSELLLKLVDAYFDLDQYDIKPESQRALEIDANLLTQILARDPALALTIEGHCDERGSAEYNLALGARRAEVAKEFLINTGVAAAALKTISYGKERPQCAAQSEECWQKNRRAHLATVQ